MDQLNAYRLLGLEPGCSREEIKEAYAALSKLYHPEDYPEKFQEIHEAYQILNRVERRNRSIENDIPVQQPVFSFTEETIETQDEHYDFDETLRRVKEADARRLHEEILRALAEFKVLTGTAYKSKVKLFKEYFKKHSSQLVLR